MEYEFHEAANIFPLIAGEEFDALVKDISENGLKQPIYLYEGKIIDGRNRYRACLQAGRDAKFTTIKDIENPISFVISLNIHRRHLTPSQRAAVAVDIETYFAAEARRRMVAGKKVPSGKISGGSGDARDQAAAVVGSVSGRYVSSAKFIKQSDESLFEKVKSGTISIQEAKREIRKNQISKSTTPIKKLKSYRIIYADPPWEYGNTMPDYATEQRDHYPTLPLKDICDFKIKVKSEFKSISEIASEDSVLFLWVTSPILKDSFSVIKSWGFNYKASFVWDKIKHNMGHYNSVRHEFLLICTRGSCLPDVKKLYDSVQSIERTKHSTKPKEFRAIIESLYTEGEKIEIFARETCEGWDSYGFECN